jgi:uncharacterized protein (TIGR02996 family)
MDDTEALLQAVLDAPDDDNPRLAYADYLQTHGDPMRAQFIRVQIALARLPEGGELHQDLERWEQAVLKRNQHEWVRLLDVLVNGRYLRFTQLWQRVQDDPRELHRLSPADRALVEDPKASGVAGQQMRDWQFRRGFIEGAAMTARAFLAHGDIITRLTPLRHVRFYQAHGELPALAAAPHLTRLEGIDSTANGLGDEDMQSLVTSPYLTGLVSLNLRGNPIGPAGLAAVRDYANLPRLAALNLRHTAIGPEGTQVLAFSLFTARLAEVNLDNTRAGDAGVEALATSPYLGGLRSLSLSGNGITDRGVRALAVSRGLANLTHLDLSHNRVEDAAAAVLGVSPRLVSLNLIGNPLSERARERLRGFCGHQVLL